MTREAIKDKTKQGASKVVFNEGTHTINIYSYESPPGLEEALGRIERLLKEIKDKKGGESI